MKAAKEPRTAGAAAATSQPEPVAAATYTLPAEPCLVQLNSDGSADVTVSVSPEILRRIRTRAQSQPLGEYIWLNIMRRALESHVY